jgi:hypothetical protein
VLAVALFAVAYWRGGVLDLPPVPSGVTSETAGVQNLALMRERAHALDALAAGGGNAVAPEGDPALAKAAAGVAAVRRGEGEAGLRQIREALSAQPDDLVIGNAYRMSVLSLRRAAITNAANRETLARHLPPYLQGESVGTLERFYREHQSREAGFQLAMAWVDEILVSPEERRAGAALASMKVLDKVLEEQPHYLPALCARGLGYLNPPARIDFVPALQAVLRPVPNAASRDLSLCVAIGAKLGGGSREVAAAQALNLGDAYAKERQPQRARSWWQLAQNLSRDEALLAGVRRRFAWGDDELIERIETERSAEMADLDHPLTDLTLTWRE